MAACRVKLITLLCILVVSFPVLAQVTGSITGTVRDSSGAVIPNAKIAVFNNDRGIHRTTITNSSGDYLVQGLGEGTYTVEVTVPGFKKFVAANTVIHVAQNARIDAPMQIGSQSTEVTVQGSNAGVVETQSSGLSTTITSEQISQLELNGRSFVQLIELSPGVSNQTGQSEGTTGPSGSVSYSINGGRTEYNNWELDGGDIMDSGSMANLNVFPNVDALDQVQVFTSGYDAQYGRSSNGTIEAVTKSGTNQFHGEAFEFLRNQLFNAANFFNPPNQRIGAYKKHDFGGMLGGPIKKDKLFFFFSEEIRRESVPGFYNFSVPTNAERAGDFSAVCPMAGAIFQTTPDSATTTSYPYKPDCPAYAPDAAGDGGFVGFPNNNISAYVDQTNSGALLPYVPQSNVIDAGTGYAFLREAAGAPYTSHQELFKIDYNIKPNLHASFRYIHDQDKQVFETSTPWAISTVPGIPGQEIYPGISMVANLQWTASSTLTNEFMVGFGDNHISITNTTSAANTPAGLTMTSLFNNGFGGKVPSFNIGGGQSYSGMTIDAGPTPFYNSNPTYTYRDTLTKLLHTHNLKTGFYYTANQKNEDAQDNTQGELGFSGINGSSYTVPSGTLPSTGVGFADFLMGEISSYSQSSAEPKYHFKFKIFEPFIQDDWHVNQRLTLNLGLRMSFYGLYSEKNRIAYNFDPSAYVAANAPTIADDGSLIFPAGYGPNNLTGIVRCGYNGVAPGCMKGHLWNPAPRIGFAYDLFGDGKTAIRGAYGIFYDHTNGNEANAESLEGQPPLVLTSYQYNVSGYTNIGGGQYYPVVLNSIPSDQVHWPYVQQWHLDVQHELMRNTMVTVSYVGSKGTHLTLQRDLNQIPVLPASENPFAPGVPITNVSCENGTLPNGVTPVTGAALQYLNVACGNVNPDFYRTAFPGYDTIDGIGFQGSSNYNALEISGRRTAKNLQVTVAYTYAHSLDNTSDRYSDTFVNSYDIRGNWANSDYDQRHILNFSYIYTLPSLATYNLPTRLALGGWQWSGITEIQTGDPFSVVGPVYDNAGVANGEGTGSYVDWAPGVSKNVSAYHESKLQPGVYGPLLFNPSAFNAPQGLTFGDSGRNTIHLPRTSNFDMGIFKHFPVKQKTTIEFRAEAFNVFNHPQFTGINNSASSCYGSNAGYTYNFGLSECVQGQDGPQSFLHPNAVHDPRIMQFALKVLF